MYSYQGQYGGYANQQPQYPSGANSVQAQAYQQAQQAHQTFYGTPSAQLNAYASYGYSAEPAQQTNQAQVYSAAPAYQTANTYGGYPTANFISGGVTQKPAASAGASQGYSYDAAVYAAANTYLHNKKPAGGGGIGRYNGGGGGGGMGVNSTKPWMNKRKFGGGSGDSKQYYCEVCKVSCAGGVTYKEHLDGQRHKKKEAMQKGEATLPLARNKLSYRCDLCEVTCAGQDTYAAHVRGAKHMKTVQLCKKLGKPIPEDVPTILAPNEKGVTETKAKSKWHQQSLPGGKTVVGINTVNFVGGTKLSTTGQLEEKKKAVIAAVSSVGKPNIEVEDEKLKAMMAAEDVQPIGEEHVTAERDATGKLIQYFCKICDCKFSDPNAKEVHTKGRRHRLSYKQKIDPKFVVDVKPSVKKSRDNQKSRRFPDSQQSQQGVILPLVRTPWFGPTSGNAKRLEIMNERTLDAVHGKLNPGKDVIENLEKLTRVTELTLKTVSEELDKIRPGDTVQIPGQPPIPTERKVLDKAAAEKLRILQGVMRVGTWSRNVFIKGDKLVELVVLCIIPPTQEILVDVQKLFVEHAVDLTLTPESSPVSFLVTMKGFEEVQCRITFTAPVLREHHEGVECADTTLCLNALAELRQAKWFSARCLYLQSCQKVVRVMRDVRRRTAAFCVYDDHIFEMLIEKVLSICPVPLSPAQAFQRVFEAIASGVLFNAVLHDPCEKSKTNVFDVATIEQKNEITTVAQNYLRMISFNQMYKVVDIERLSDIRPSLSNERKRPNSDVLGQENGQNDDDNDEEIEVKRERLDENEDHDENENGQNNVEMD